MRLLRLAPNPSPQAGRGDPTRARGEGHATTATAADIEALDALAQRLMAAFAARRLRARRAGGDPAGRPVPRRGGREPARAHLRVHRSGRRRAVPAPRPHRADLPAAPGAPPRGRRARPLLLFRLGLPLPAGGRRQRASARVPPGRHRVVRRRRPRAGGRRRAGAHVAALREAGFATCGCNSAISACSPRSSTRSPCPSAGARASGTSSGGPEAFRAELARLATGPERDGGALDDAARQA